MILFDSHAGIHLSSFKLQLAEISQRSNQFLISNIEEVYFLDEINFSNDKLTKIGSILNSALEELLIKKSISSALVSYSLPQELFITSKFQFEPALLEADLIEEFKWQLSILYPFLNWNEYAVKYFEIDSSNSAFNNSALVFALNRKYIKLLSDISDNHNLKLKYIDHCHLTSNNILELQGLSEQHTRLSFYISKNMLSVLAVEHNKPIYYQDIPIKKITDVQTFIADELYKLKLLHLNFNEAFLFGENISQSIAENLSSYTSVNFKVVNPFSHLNANGEIITNRNYTEKYHLFNASAGTAIRL